jgi:pimeloyl-ACP methyl ester carboxylesterase
VDGKRMTEAETTLNSKVLGLGEPPLIMLHGWGQSLVSLYGLADLLSKSRQVHLIDLPGFGLSPKPPSDWNNSEYAERIFAYMEEKGIRRADVLGHSFGGRISIRLASLHPDAIRKVILINSSGLKGKATTKRTFRMQLAQLSAKTCRALDRNFGFNTFETWHVPKFASIDYKNSGELRNIFVKTVNEDLSECLPKVAQPVLLLWGERDAETPVSVGERFAELLPDAKFVVLPGKDHFPFLNEGAHLCGSHIIRFLDRSDVLGISKNEERLSRV